VSIAVRDNGSGIPPDDRTRIFHVFARLTESCEKGLGIDLAVARQLVEQHGGRIQAQSGGRGLGSKFTINLPRVMGATKMESV